MRLNGWQRIGIVLSVLYAVFGFFWGNSTAIDDLGAGAASTLEYCLQQPSDDGWKHCHEAFSRDWPVAIANHWYYAFGIALIPIPIAWLIAYGFIALGRWIAAGFKKRR